MTSADHYLFIIIHWDSFNSSAFKPLEINFRTTEAGNMNLKQEYRTKQSNN